MVKIIGNGDFNFLELFIKFSLDEKEFELRDITGNPSKVISYHGMTKLLKKGHKGIITQLLSLDVQTSKSSKQSQNSVHIPSASFGSQKGLKMAKLPQKQDYGVNKLKVLHLIVQHFFSWLIGKHFIINL